MAWSSICLFRCTGRITKTQSLHLTMLLERISLRAWQQSHCTICKTQHKCECVNFRTIQNNRDERSSIHLNIANVIPCNIRHGSKHPPRNKSYECRPVSCFDSPLLPTVARLASNSKWRLSNLQGFARITLIYLTKKNHIHNLSNHVSVLGPRPYTCASTCKIPNQHFKTVSKPIKQKHTNELPKLSKQTTTKRLYQNTQCDPPASIKASCPVPEGSMGLMCMQTPPISKVSEGQSCHNNLNKLYIIL